MYEAFAAYIKTAKQLTSLHLQTALKHSWLDLAEEIFQRVTKYDLSDALNNVIRWHRPDCEEWLYKHGTEPWPDIWQIYIEADRIAELLKEDLTRTTFDQYLHYAAHGGKNDLVILLLQYFVEHFKNDPNPYVECKFIFKMCNKTAHTIALENGLCKPLVQFNREEMSGTGDLRQLIIYSDVILPYIKGKQKILTVGESIPNFDPSDERVKQLCEYPLHFAVDVRRCIKHGRIEVLVYLRQNPGKATITFENENYEDIEEKIPAMHMHKVVPYLQHQVKYNLNFEDLLLYYFSSYEPCNYESPENRTFLRNLLAEVQSGITRKEARKETVKNILMHPDYVDIIRIYFNQVSSKCTAILFEEDDIVKLRILLEMCIQNDIKIHIDWETLVYVKSKDMAKFLMESVGEEEKKKECIPEEILWDHPGVFDVFVQNGCRCDMEAICWKSKKEDWWMDMTKFQRQLFLFADLAAYPHIEKELAKYDARTSYLLEVLSEYIPVEVVKHIIID